MLKESPTHLPFQHIQPRHNASSLGSICSIVDTMYCIHCVYLAEQTTFCQWLRQIAVGWAFQCLLINWLVCCWSYTSWQHLRSYQGVYRFGQCAHMLTLQVMALLPFPSPGCQYHNLISHYPDTEPTSRRFILRMPNAWLGSDNYQFLRHCFDLTRIWHIYLHLFIFIFILFCLIGYRVGSLAIMTMTWVIVMDQMLAVPLFWPQLI